MEKDVVFIYRIGISDPYQQFDKLSPMEGRMFMEEVFSRLSEVCSDLSDVYKGITFEVELDRSDV